MVDDLRSLNKGKVGNKSRTGMPRPAGSGRPPSTTHNFTFRVPDEERARWDQLAAEMHITTGEMVREAVKLYIADLYIEEFEGEV